MLNALRLALAFALALSSVSPASAGIFRCRRSCRPAASCGTSYQQSRPCASAPAACGSVGVTLSVGMSPGSGPVPHPSPMPAVVPPDTSALGWINAQRARVGLHGLIYDGAMASDAAASNAAMRQRGFAHHFQFAPHQKCVGTGSLDQVLIMWLADPPHAQALMSGGITRAAIVFDGTFVTFSAY